MGPSGRSGDAGPTCRPGLLCCSSSFISRPRRVLDPKQFVNHPQMSAMISGQDKGILVSMTDLQVWPGRRRLARGMGEERVTEGTRPQSQEGKGSVDRDFTPHPHFAARQVEELGSPRDRRKILLFFRKNSYFRNEVVEKEYVLRAAGKGASAWRGGSRWRRQGCT